MAPPPPPVNLMQPFGGHGGHGGQYMQEPMNHGYQGFQPAPQATAAPSPPEPPKPIEKAPIPSEHQILQEVFDGLKDKCLSAANHPVR